MRNQPVVRHMSRHWLHHETSGATCVAPLVVFPRTGVTIIVFKFLFENRFEKFEIENYGDMDGEEIVQLYIRDNVSSATRPVKELKGYKRVFLVKGTSKTVSFEIDESMLAFYDINMDYCVEPGDFSIMVGSSSADIDLKSVNLTVNNRIKIKD